MDHAVSPSDSLQDCLRKEGQILDGFIRCIDGLIAVTLGHESAAHIREETRDVPQSCVPVLGLLLQAAGSSAHTLVGLSDRSGLHTRDCYSVVRSIVEVAVNICYIIAEGPPAAERAVRHARQKSFRDLNLESTVGNTLISLAFSGRPDASSIEGLEAELAEFTSRSNREKPWINLSIDDRIAATGKLSTVVATELHWATFAVYRHSSEILHGTFFGALFFFGQTTPPGRPKSLGEFRESVGQQHMLILMSAIMAFSAVVEAFHAGYGFSAAHKHRVELIESLRAIPYFQATDHADQ